MPMPLRPEVVNRATVLTETPCSRLPSGRRDSGGTEQWSQLVCLEHLLWFHSPAGSFLPSPWLKLPRVTLAGGLHDAIVETGWKRFTVKNK